MREFRQSRLGTLKKINCKFSDLQIISVARDFEQMQEIPPHHFFSSINFEGYPLPDFWTKRFPAPEWKTDKCKTDACAPEWKSDKSAKSTSVRATYPQVIHKS